MAHAIGLDVGGTNIKGVVTDETGAVLEQRRIPTPRSSDTELLDGIGALARELLDTIVARGHESTPAIGVAIAGFLDAERSRVRLSPNLPLHDSLLQAELEQRVGMRVRLENDANAAGIAEFSLGAGSDRGDMVFLTLGTGLGSAIFVNGGLVLGAFGIGGEIGHFRLVPGGVPCPCGQRGCFEQYASGTALLRIAGEIADRGGIGDALARARGTAAEIDAADLSALAEAGDAGAREAIDELATWLGEGCASLASVLDPSCFVLGGGVAEGLGELLRMPTERAFARALPAAEARPAAEFRLARLGNLAGAIGAAELARTRESATE